MSSLTQFFAGIIYRAILNTISLLSTLLKAAFEGIFYLNNAITYRLTPNKIPQDVTATILAIECPQGSNSFCERPQESNENIFNKQPENNESFSQVTYNLTENQSESAHNDSYVLVNINEENSLEGIEENLQKGIEENSQKGIEENPNVMRVNITALFLRCCDRCAVDGSTISEVLSAENINRTNANHDKNVLKSMVNLNQNDNSPNSLGYLQPPKDKIEVKKEEDIDERNKEDNECFLGCLNCTMKCCECTIV